MPNQSSPKPVFPSSIETVWFVGFSDSMGPIAWWQLFTKECFRHVYMYTRFGEDTWLTVSMSRGGLVITNFSEKGAIDLGFPNIHVFLADLWHGRVILASHGLVTTAIEIPRMAPFTCVELARSLLGIDKMLWTPWQLYRYIIKNRLVPHLQKDLPSLG